MQLAQSIQMRLVFFDEQINLVRAKNPDKKIYIDFTKVKMITSACIRCLLKFKKKITIKNRFFYVN